MDAKLLFCSPTSLFTQLDHLMITPEFLDSDSVDKALDLLSQMFSKQSMTVQDNTVVACAPIIFLKQSLLIFFFSVL